MPLQKLDLKQKDVVVRIPSLNQKHQAMHVKVRGKKGAQGHFHS